MRAWRLGRGLAPGALWTPVVKTQRRRDLRVLVQTDTDVVRARHRGREFASVLGLGSVEVTIVATVISELARGIRRDVGRGEIVLAPPEDTSLHGVVMTVRHEGERLRSEPEGAAPRLHTIGTAGCWRWLDGLKRDEFEILPDGGGGAIVTIRWNV